MWYSFIPYLLISFLCFFVANAKIVMENSVTGTTVEISASSFNHATWPKEANQDAVGVDDLPIVLLLSPSTMSYDEVDYCDHDIFYNPDKMLTVWGPYLKDKYNITTNYDNEKEPETKWLGGNNFQPWSYDPICKRGVNANWIAPYFKLFLFNLKPLGAVGGLICNIWIDTDHLTMIHQPEVDEFNGIVRGVDVGLMNNGEGPVTYGVAGMFSLTATEDDRVFWAEMDNAWLAANNKNGSVTWRMKSHTEYKTNDWANAARPWTGYGWWTCFIYLLLNTAGLFLYLVYFEPFYRTFLSSLRNASSAHEKQVMKKNFKIRLSILVPELISLICRTWGYDNLGTVTFTSVGLYSFLNYFCYGCESMTDIATLFYGFDLLNTIVASRTLQKRKSIFEKFELFFWIAMGLNFMLFFCVGLDLYIRYTEGIETNIVIQFLSSTGVNLGTLEYFYNGIMLLIVTIISAVVSCKLGPHIRWAKERSEASGSGEVQLKRLQGLINFQRLMLLTAAMRLLLIVNILLASITIQLFYTFPSYFWILGGITRYGRLIASAVQIGAALQLPDGSSPKRSTLKDTVNRMTGKSKWDSSSSAGFSESGASSKETKGSSSGSSSATVSDTSNM